MERPTPSVIARSLWLGLGLLLGLATAAPLRAEQAVDTSRWDAYLDFAYVYVSAEPVALAARLEQYAAEAGMSLEEYVVVSQAGRDLDDGRLDEDTRRRIGIAHLLRYLSSREPRALDAAIDAFAEFGEAGGRHENLHWHHYALAHRALEKGNAKEFTRHVLDLWLDVVVPLESPYETLQALSLSQSANSGFVSALPYVFENIARVILIRSQEMGLRRDLDPLAAIVRMLGTGRVGAHPEVIPSEGSAKQYLDRIIARLDGVESDGGSLTFTLLLFEAGKYHDQARGLLASEGFSPAAVEAIGVAAGAYQHALSVADTLQGQAAIYTRVLRQLGEVWAAKQRLGVDPYVELPFSIEGAMAVYDELHQAGEHGEWAEAGFRATGFDAYRQSLRALWEEIQEASLNAADYYLTRSMAEPARADQHTRNAARTYASYLAFFEKYAARAGVEGVPDSAFFAAYEAAKGYGDAFLAYQGSNPSIAEVASAVDRYEVGLRAYPFDRHLWPAFAAGLERQGRSSDFLARARPIADAVARSRHVDTWITDQEPGAAELVDMRRALGDELALMYLGFADGAEVSELEQSLQQLMQRTEQVRGELLALKGVPGGQTPPAARAEGTPSSSGGVIERAERSRKIEEKSLLLEKLEKQLAARQRALPLFEATFGADGLIPQLRGQRDHPVHTLLRRLYYEGRD